MINISELKERLHYNPDTGIFTWIAVTSAFSRIKIGDKAGSYDSAGYVIIGFDNKYYKAHRLAWLFMNGEFPPNVIDHINGVKDDNRYANLRTASITENGYNRKTSKNNTIGYKGVTFHQKRQIYRSSCSVAGKRYYFSPFDTALEAFEAVQKFRTKHHGVFVNKG